MRRYNNTNAGNVIRERKKFTERFDIIPFLIDSIVLFYHMPTKQKGKSNDYTAKQDNLAQVKVINYETRSDALRPSFLAVFFWSFLLCERDFLKSPLSPSLTVFQDTSCPENDERETP